MYFTILYGQNDQDQSLRNQIIVFSINEIVISGVFIITLFSSQEIFQFPYRDTLMKISLISVWLLNLINITLAQSFIYKSTQNSVATTFIALLTTGLIFSLFLKDQQNIYQPIIIII
ncbi:unnamed protein product [Paramecium pentaurelia]|uniref:Uncharacterized protein n=1 Tax=Paramecium pentaurelia TaxID=43138 RepID=A0A8S1SYS1_9CILI|nr:unnamed protein product [Paramecium pentaurelia]